MGIRTDKYGVVSYESKELIEELRADIAEFGAGHKFAVWLRTYPEYGGVEFAVNYDFMSEEMPIEPDEVRENERIVTMTASELMGRLIDQDAVF